uniref:Pyrimidine 5'-nucleotidase n=1 Tax=viral metagenome TaxID=1070528 RepID=A0A6C0EKI4_9ZZZZ
MPNYIFDLDFTLYSKHDIDQTTNTKYYKSIEPNLFLNKLLSRLNGTKYIFSNGNKSHVDFIVDKMHLKSFFNKIATSDDYPTTIKPHMNAYNYVLKNFNLKKQPTYFFEDTMENLLTAKKLGWKTVFINNDGLSDKEIQKHKYVDYKFSCVEQALLFFINSKL